MDWGSRQNTRRRPCGLLLSLHFWEGREPEGSLPRTVLHFYGVMFVMRPTNHRDHPESLGSDQLPELVLSQMATLRPRSFVTGRTLPLSSVVVEMKPVTEQEFLSFRPGQTVTAVVDNAGELKEVKRRGGAGPAR